jgi:(2Fe-2S) ferredoxin
MLQQKELREIIMPEAHYRVFVCTKQRSPEDPDGCCHDCGSAAVLAALEQAITAANLGDRVQVRASGCLDHCESGAVAMVFRPQGRSWSWLPKKVQTKLLKKFATDRVFYGNLTPTDIPELVQQHLVKGKIFERARLKI